MPQANSQKGYRQLCFSGKSAGWHFAPNWHWRCGGRMNAGAVRITVFSRIGKKNACISKIGLNKPLNLPLRKIRTRRKVPKNWSAAEPKMQLPSIDRTPHSQPAGANVASMAAGRVIPVTPVNPSVSAAPSIEPTAGVVNLVNQANKASSGEAVYTSVSDPGRRGSEAATSEKDWTIHRPVAEKVQDPPPVPLAKMLMDHLRSMWLASASAVQVQQVKNQLDASQPNPNATPGVLTTEVLTYSLSKIKKTGNI